MRTVHGPPTEEFHYDLGRSYEAVAILRVTGPRDESWGIFPTNQQLPAMTVEEASRFGTVVGTKIREENS
jgi:hypothetical protein